MPVTGRLDQVNQNVSPRDWRFAAIFSFPRKQLYTFRTNIFCADFFEAGVGLPVADDFAAQGNFTAAAVLNDVPGAAAEQDDGVVFFHSW